MRHRLACLDDYGRETLGKIMFLSLITFQILSTVERDLSSNSKFAVQEILPRSMSTAERICLESGSLDYKFEINDKHDQKCNH